MKKANHLFLSVLMVFLALAGCGKKADTSKPVDQIKTEVQNMSLTDLEANAKAYAKEIASQKSEVEKISEQIKAFSVKDLLSEKADSIKAQMEQIGNQVSALTERYQVYADKFLEKGGDIAKIQISQA